MTLAFACEIVLAGLLLAIATWTIAARTAFAAIAVFMVYGLLLSIVWVTLSSVDVALTEAAIGGGVTSMVLLGAASALRGSKGAVASLSLPFKITAGVLCALVSAALATVVFFLPDVAPTLAPVAKENLAASALGNPVAAVLFVFRALDTLLEKVVLLLALVGVWSLSSDRAWGGVPELRLYKSPSPILVFLAQILPPIGIIVGIYMFWAGASQPGGAFQGGTVLAAMWLLTMMARLQNVPSTNARWPRVLLVVGPMAFLAVGLAGFYFADSFLAYPPSIAKPLIIVVEATLTVSIGVTLALLVAGPPERVPQQ
jgi:multisubunit Na+/H+ antiporter MnhB subunit